VLIISLLKEVVKHLTTDIIKGIRETELAAEEKIKAAQQKAKDILMFLKKP